MTRHKYCSGGVLEMDRVREILRLAAQGYRQREIHRATGVARSTIQEYLRAAKLHDLSFEKAKALSDVELKGLLRRKTPGRPPKQASEPDFSKLKQDYQSRKGVTLELLWQEWVAETGGGYGYSTFCRHYEQANKASQVTMRRDYEPGELMLSDFAGESLNYFENGEEFRAEIFVATLGLSNRTYVEALPSQQLQHWLGVHARAFLFFGGVTEAVSIDNLKAGVSKSCRYEPEINRSFQELAEHFNTTVFPARSRKPRDKAKVEKAVQDVERWVLAPLRKERFNSLYELNQAMHIKLLAFNAREMVEYEMSRDTFFEKAERSALRPLPTLAFCSAIWKRARVNMDYHVELTKHWYSVPYTLVHKEVWIKASERLVEIFFDNQRTASHARSNVPHRHTTDPTHMPPHHLAVRNWKADGFRDWAKTVGEQTCKLVELFLSAPRYQPQAYRSLLGVQRLHKKYGTDQLEAACAIAVKHQVPSQRYLNSILERNGQPEQPLPHSNVRGPKFYH